MDREIWIAKRTIEIQKAVEKKEIYCDEKGIIFFGSSECASEEAEQEYNNLFGNDEESKE